MKYRRVPIDKAASTVYHAPGPDRGHLGAYQSRAGFLARLEAFGVVFQIIASVVTLATLQDWIAYSLVVGGAVLGTSLLLRTTTHSPWSRRSIALFAVQGLALAALVAGAIVTSTDDDADVPTAATGTPVPTPTPTSGSSQTLPAPSTSTTPVAPEPAPVVVRDGYDLTPSSFIDTNDQDKVDLDTGCAGWGNQRPRLGPPRCGELADLIVDEEGIHNSNTRPNIVRVVAGSTASYDGCLAALTAEPDSSVSQISVSDLESGDQLCVETDLEKIALVEITDVTTDDSGGLATLELSFRVWEK